MANIWDEYQQYVQSGASDAAKAAAQGTPAPPTVTSGNTAWRNAQNPTQPTPQDPVGAAQQPTPAPYTLPAVQQLNPYTKAARNAPVNTLAMNAQPAAGQIPVGGFGLGLGYRPQQVNLGSFLGLGQQQPQQPTLTGYKWNKGTGGVSGGNNDLLTNFYSNGTSRSFTGGIENNVPLAPTRYTLPGVNADVRALSDPSVGALEGATRTTRGGQEFVNPVGGGQIISGPAGSTSYGSLAGSTPAADKFNRPGLNTPSGGQAFAGPSLRKPPNFGIASQGQTYLGGWY